MVIVLCFDNSDGDIGFMEEDIVGTFVFPTCGDVSSDDYAPLRQFDLLANLCVKIPSRCGNGGGDVFGVTNGLRLGAWFERQT